MDGQRRRSAAYGDAWGPCWSAAADRRRRRHRSGVVDTSGRRAAPIGAQTGAHTKAAAVARAPWRLARLADLCGHPRGRSAVRDMPDAGGPIEPRRVDLVLGVNNFSKILDIR